MNFNVTTYEKFTDNEFRFLTAANLVETTHCQFSMELSKNPICSYLERPLKCSAFFRQHICVRPDFLHVLEPKTYHHTLNIEVYMKIQLSLVKQDRRLAKM